ncbi:MAG: ADP-dependent NAD(P)H-hydrate dehydratase / NAD(P)H-hydrate epimerase, partial [Gaiellaceae bacterium]|nr:ADP-dependent NAD(P)H-hydrate dehydratase / NAD(P)H-hydrate epimerase [Gaiellaceae bacterium]
GEPDVILDALFGTGFSGEPRPEAAALIERINAAGAPVLAIDLPSGVDASTGEVVGAAVRAVTTVTFHGRKVGLEIAPGRFHAGAVHVVDIGLEPTETALRCVLRKLLAEVPRRGPADNKYTAGHVLVVGGSAGLTGAPALCAEAALRADAGYVTVAAPRSALPALEGRLLEAVKRPLPEEDGVVAAAAAETVLELAAKASAVALGPGLGRGAGPREVVRRLLAELDRPAVVDADGLHGLEPFDRSAPTVLTPHEGELGHLLGVQSDWVAAHRLEAVRRAAENFHCVCLLKGADTLVAAPGEGVIVVSLGTPALATAGSGDVLTGIVAAFLSKGVDARTAAAAGAAAQQLASRVIPQSGAVASDISAALPLVLDAPV